MHEQPIQCEQCHCAKEPPAPRAATYWWAIYFDVMSFRQIPWEPDIAPLPQAYACSDAHAKELYGLWTVGRLKFREAHREEERRERSR